jgi:transcriptional regulator with XRE-family HTH domain
MNKVKRKRLGRPRRSDAEIDLPALGSRIKQLRGEQTQADFARQFRISQAQLSKYELGQTAPPLGLLIRLSKESGRSLDWILGAS